MRKVHAAMKLWLLDISTGCLDKGVPARHRAGKGWRGGSQWACARGTGAGARGGAGCLQRGGGRALRRRACARAVRLLRLLCRRRCDDPRLGRLHPGVIQVRGVPSLYPF
jgi:hypothetical protein